MNETNRGSYESKIEQEEELLDEKIRIVHDMEKEEMELIQRLQNTQMLQQQAYEALEGALRGRNKNDSR